MKCYILLPSLFPQATCFPSGFHGPSHPLYDTFPQAALCNADVINRPRVVQAALSPATCLFALKRLFCQLQFKHLSSSSPPPYLLW
ncbi:hypothetical protein Bca4012_070484 [Brassica carinata]